jgi:xanthine dehydrogenase iron-sulfur cluster and FAD-binding subunit A
METLMLGDFEYLAPATVEETLALLGEEGARPLAGGTDLLIHLRAGLAQPSCLVDLAGLGLSYIQPEAGVIKIGATCTLTDLLAAPAIRRNLTCLCEAAAEFGAVQSRNMATVGGNLCSAVPSADLAPPLLALDAHLKLAARDGERVLALEHFFTGPKTTTLAADEVLLEIRVAIPPPRTGTSFLKLGRRQAMTLAVVNVATLISLAEDGRTVEAIRIALGAVAPIPLRARRGEAVLHGRELSEPLINEAAATAAGETAPISDLRATADYRREVSRVLVKRALLDSWRKAVEDRDRVWASGDGTGLQAEDVRSRTQLVGVAQQHRTRLAGVGAIPLRVNGRPETVKVKPQALLLDVLRDQLGLVGTKHGCGTGECGACTVLLDGQPINACLMLALQAQNREITTIEGLGTPEDLHPLQQAFVTHGAVQCGYCAPAMLLSAKALLAQNPAPTEREIRTAIAGNICRCTGYVKIVESVRAAAEVMARGGDPR